MQTKRIGETQSDVEGKALLDKLSDSLVEVKTMSIWKNWVMYRPRNRSTRKLTH